MDSFQYPVGSYTLCSLEISDVSITGEKKIMLLLYSHVSCDVETHVLS